MIEITHVRRDNELLQHLFQAERDALEAKRARERAANEAAGTHERAALKCLVNHIAECSGLPVSYEKLDSHLKALRGF